MDRKRLSVILPSVIGAGLCLVEALKLAFQFQATDRKDVASGHVEAIRFVPVISTDWDYITRPQMFALSVAMVAVMLLAAAMLTSRWWVRSGAPEGESGSCGPAKATVHRSLSGSERRVWTPSASEAPERASVPLRHPDTPKSFGRRAH